jgi:enoyl-CoA hydratase/carnithine racemase
MATITVNRPDSMNTFSIPMSHEFISAIDAAEADDEVRAIIITGTGKRAFCAGADLGGGAETFDYAAQGDAGGPLMANGIYRDWGGLMTLRLFQCNKPVIAAINGAAAGIGATLLTAMDIRIASTAAKYVFPFARRGIALDAASGWFLPHLVGLPTALEWCMTGRVILAAEAKDRGLVQYLHEPDDVMPAARAIAREIVDNTAPMSVALIRQMLWRMAGARHPMDAHRADSRAVQYLGQSADAKEGITSFLEKRQPHFTGRITEGLPDIFPDWEEPQFF